MRGPLGAERLREWLTQHRQVKEHCANRRARVLAHDWAHPRLCFILQITDATHWNGYIPPPHDCQGRLETPGRNPVRAALFELLRDVAAAEAETTGIAQ